MIHGIGTDLAEIGRFVAGLDRFGERFASKILDASELPDFRGAPESARFLAKRFAAKEAFGKALGTGIRAPAVFHDIRVGHDVLGKPSLNFGAPLRAYMDHLGLHAHLSISDESAYAIAVVVIEREVGNGR